MPNYYNPYNFYPVSYMQPMSVPTNPGMSQAPAPVQQGPKMMEWVDGEVGAKAFPMPNGWPANSPIPLWDSTDTVIYLKSWGPMGIPNPMQKLKYEMPEQHSALLQGGMSGATQQTAPDMSQYVTKQDLEEIRREMRNAMNNRGNQNGSNNVQNRGGNG